MWMQIALLVLAFVLIYTGLHMVVYYALRPLWRPLKWPSKLFRMISFIMICLPIISRILERNGFPGIAGALAGPAYIWMGFILIGLAVALAAWILRGAAALLRRGSRPGGGRIWAFLVLVVSLGLMYYGYQEAAAPRLVRFEVTTPRLQENSTGVRIVQIGDLHLNAATRSDYLKNLVLRIKELKPDVLVSSGDLIDGILDPAGLEVQMFSELTPRLGKFAVTGNHEYINGAAYSQTMHENMGFRMLRGEVAKIAGLLNLAGVDDPRRETVRQTEAALMKSIQNETFTVLLKHRPELDAESDGLFDLQLSGHTHGGQLFPYIYLISMMYPRIAGPYPLSKRGVIYTSRGTGTWGPPFRLLAPPEITVFDVKHGKSFGFMRMP